MHQSTHVRHHPDIRWVVVVTVLITTTLVLFVYTMWDVTRPRPALAQQVASQQAYIAQLQGTVTQLTTINSALQAEVEKKGDEVAQLQVQLLANKINTNSSTKKQ